MITHSRVGNGVWPVIDRACHRVLDIGCGNGDALARAEIRGLAVGIDIDLASLAAGSGMFPQNLYCQAMGEALPFQDGAFDALLSRVSLPYMDIRAALREAARVCRAGGEVWFVFHRPSFVTARLGKELRTMHLRGILFTSYIILNGLCFHIFGRMFRYPLNRARCESFQTESGIRRALARAGFEEVKITERVPFVVTARKAARR